MTCAAYGDLVRRTHRALMGLQLEIRWMLENTGADPRAAQRESMRMTKPAWVAWDELIGATREAVEPVRDGPEGS